MHTLDSTTQKRMEKDLQTATTGEVKCNTNIRQNRLQNVSRDKEGHFIMVCTYITWKTAPKQMERKLAEMKGEINNSSCRLQYQIFNNG